MEGVTWAFFKGEFQKFSVIMEKVFCDIASSCSSVVHREALVQETLMARGDIREEVLHILWFQAVNGLKDNSQHLELCPETNWKQAVRQFLKNWKQLVGHSSYTPEILG